jgi:DNA/RNA-binding domain of Phe-tRNA-synthetase-like protein
MELPSIHFDPHPLADWPLIVAEFPRPLASAGSSPELLRLLAMDAVAPLASSDEVRAKVRDLLRYGGFKPTGRSKPAAEYLLRAASEGTLGPINLAVDVCNAVSLHSGLPISVIDLDRATPPLHIAIAPPETQYIFNSAGQSIDVSGLVCLCDAAGPCANAVKDSQRTKTHGETRRTLTIIWGSIAMPGRANATAAWYCQLLQAHGAVVAVLGN